MIPSTSTKHPLTNKLVYLVDDDEDDALMFERAINEVIPYCKLRVFQNGLVMLEIMAEPGAKPHLIFLDLNMPYPDGLEVLTNLKINRLWADIPVIILTGSEAPEQIQLAYQLGAQTVINKPSRYSDLVDIIIGIRQYWFSIARLPQTDA
jgi:two-component system response regulator